MEQQHLFPRYINDSKLREYIARHVAIENEQDRLRQLLTALDEECKPHLPVKETKVQLKIARLRRKQARRPEDSLSYPQQDYLRDKIEGELDRLEQEATDLGGLELGDSTMEP